jgi:hypothetical protein
LTVSSEVVSVAGAEATLSLEGMDVEAVNPWA